MQAKEVVLSSASIDIVGPLHTKGSVTRKGGKGICRSSTKLWEFCKEDPSRLTFSIKVGLTISLVALLILVREPYDVFGPNVVWAILTVVVVFEQTVGGTIGKGLNRALGSIAAGTLAFLIAQIALTARLVAQPIIIGFSIFFLGSLATFIKQWPSMREYEYGFRVYIFTFCIIIISSYRLGNPVRTIVDRIYSISIGGASPMLVSAIVFPSWAGEQLHQQIVKNFEYVADSLEECVRLYLEETALIHAKSTNFVDDLEYCDGEQTFKRYITLNSSAKEETLAKSARWEPPHGRFKAFFYPWAQYVKVGAVLRHCAYEVTALHRCLHSELQAPQKLRNEFAKELRDASTNAAKLIRELGSNIDKMQSSSLEILLKKVHAAAECLQHKIDTHSHLVLPNTCKDLETKPLLISSPPEGLCNGDNPCDGGEAPEMKKLGRRLHSWPSLEIDLLEEGHMDDHAHEVPTKIRAHESINALSFITFASLLIEFLARLDHLVHTVEQLGKLAKFRHE